MSKAGKQFSLVGGVDSGAGAFHTGVAATNQTGNLLDIIATVHTPSVKVGYSHTNFSGKKLRFGVVNAKGGDSFNYPELAIKNPEGNGQSYRSSKIGYLPGNDNAGTGGFGRSRDVDLSTIVSGDLTDAFRVADFIEHPDLPQHSRNVNRDYETMREHLEEQSKEHQKEKIAHLMAMGFSEEEIRRKADKDREKAIEQAATMESQPHHTLSKALEKSRGNIADIGFSVAPGLVSQRQNMDSYQRAVGAGTLTQKGKAMQAIRRKEMMSAKIDEQKPQSVNAKLPSTHSAIVEMMMALAGKEEHKRQESTLVHQEQIVTHQKMKEDARVARHFAMSKALEKK